MCGNCKAMLPAKKFGGGFRFKRNLKGRQYWCSRCRSNLNRDTLKRLQKHREARMARFNLPENYMSKKLARWQKRVDREIARLNAHVSARRALKLKACPPWVSSESISKIYLECRAKTAETGIPHHVDHIIPLKSRHVCGLHVPWNLQVITAEENLRKNNKFKPKWEAFGETSLPPAPRTRYRSPAPPLSAHHPNLNSPDELKGRQAGEILKDLTYRNIESQKS
jgi:hypothetical protein